MSRDHLLEEVWGFAPSVISPACDNTVRRLRRKIERDSTEPEHLLTVHGEGYRFHAVQAEASPPPTAGSAVVDGLLVDLERFWMRGSLVLARFRRAFPPADAEAVLGPQALGWVRALRDRSLIQVHADELHVLEPLRQLADEVREGRDDGGRDLDRHWIDGLLRRYGRASHLRTLRRRGREDAFDGQRSRIDDLVAAVEAAVAQGWSLRAIQAADAACDVLRTEGPIAALVATVDLLIEPPESDPGARSRLAWLRGVAAQEQGYDERAVVAFEQARDYAQAAGDDVTATRAIEELSVCHFDLRIPEKAQAFAARAIDANLAIGDHAGAAYQRGRLGASLGRPLDELRDHYERALDLARGAGDMSLVGVAAFRLSQVERDLGRPELSLTHLSDAIEAAGRLGRHPLDARARAYRLLLLGLLGRHEALDDELPAATDASQGLPYRDAESEVGMYHLRSLILRSAAAPATHALSVLCAMVAGLHRDIAHRNAYLDLREAEILLAMGDPRSAGDRAERGRAWFAEHGDRLNQAEGEAVCARCRLDRRDLEQALAHAHDAVRTYEARAPAFVAVGLSVRGQVRAALGEEGAARADLEAGIEAAQASGYGVAPQSYFGWWLAPLREAVGGEPPAPGTQSMP